MVLIYKLKQYFHLLDIVLDTGDRQSIEQELNMEFLESVDD